MLDPISIRRFGCADCTIASARRSFTTDSTWKCEQHEIFGVVGGSGAGKSVLLRSILGLRHPDSGSVELYGRDVESLAATDRSSLVQSYGVTFQNGALISSLTVAQNIQLPLREHYSLSEKTLDELARYESAHGGSGARRRRASFLRSCPAE